MEGLRAIPHTSRNFSCSYIPRAAIIYAAQQQCACACALHNADGASVRTCTLQKMLWSIAIFLVSFTATRSNQTSNLLPLPSDRLTCTYLQHPLCRNTGYNQTAFPNSREHATQDEAAAEMADFAPLWNRDTPCSNAIVHLLCAFYFPFCGSTGKDNITLKPCRSLCEEARAGCESVIEQNSAGGQWPWFLNCSWFPDREEDSEICFGPPDPSILDLPDETSASTPSSNPSVVPMTTDNSSESTPRIIAASTAIMPSAVLFLCYMMNSV